MTRFFSGFGGFVLIFKYLLSSDSMKNRVFKVRRLEQLLVEPQGPQRLCVSDHHHYSSTKPKRNKFESRGERRTTQESRLFLRNKSGPKDKKSPKRKRMQLKAMHNLCAIFGGPREEESGMEETRIAECKNCHF